MVPNQPLVFHDDGVPGTEDDLIGYAWDQYLSTGDPRWAPRNAMVNTLGHGMICCQQRGCGLGGLTCREPIPYGPGPT